MTSLPSPARVAVFRALQLGDLLCAVPALRALRAAWPGARITLVGLPWARDFVRRMPCLDHFIAFPGAPGLPECEPDLEHWPAFIAEVRSHRFDLAIQLHGSGELTNALVAGFGAARSAGFIAPGHANPDPRSYLAWPEQLPEVRRLLALARLLGAPACGEHLELPVLPAERRAFATLLAGLPIGPRGYVCVHAGARLATRRWPAARFGAVADHLARAGVSVILTGTASEAPLAAAVRAAMGEPAIDLTGRTTLGTLTALVAQARLVVCNDTGMSHVAAAVGTPSVVVCCGADPGRWRPLDAARHRVLWHDVACRPCTHQDCPSGHECALGVDPAAVGAQALSLLAAREGHHVAG